MNIFQINKLTTAQSKVLSHVRESLSPGTPVVDLCFTENGARICEPTGTTLDFIYDKESDSVILKESVNN